jgi:hypothetical protein
MKKLIFLILLLIILSAMAMAVVGPGKTRGIVQPGVPDALKIVQ